MVPYALAGGALCAAVMVAAAAAVGHRLSFNLWTLAFFVSMIGLLTIASCLSLSADRIARFARKDQSSAAPEAISVPPQYWWTTPTVATCLYGYLICWASWFLGYATAAAMAFASVGTMALCVAWAAVVVRGGPDTPISHVTAIVARERLLLIVALCVALWCVPVALGIASVWHVGLADYVLVATIPAIVPTIAFARLWSSVLSRRQTWSIERNAHVNRLLDPMRAPIIACWLALGLVILSWGWLRGAPEVRLVAVAPSGACIAYLIASHVHCLKKIDPVDSER
jgi:hypothetical protein